MHAKQAVQPCTQYSTPYDMIPFNTERDTQSMLIQDMGMSKMPGLTGAVPTVAEQFYGAS